MLAPVRYDDGALLLLDQTRLPAEERWLRCTRPEEVADAIRRLAVRGAPAIGLAAAWGLVLAMRAPEGDAPGAGEALAPAGGAPAAADAGRAGDAGVGVTPAPMERFERA